MKFMNVKIKYHSNNKVKWSSIIEESKIAFKSIHTEFTKLK